MMELRKLEQFWVLIVRHEDGTVNNYRFNTKTEAKKWAKSVGYSI